MRVLFHFNFFRDIIFIYSAFTFWMYSMSLVTLNNDNNLLHLWVSIYVLHDARCQRHNKSVYCSMFCFVSTQRCRSGAKHWAFQKEKRRKQNITIFAFVSLNVYANVFIVFKTVGERCLCHIRFFLSFLNLNLHRCFESSLVPKTTSSPCEP